MSRLLTAAHKLMVVLHYSKVVLTRANGKCKVLIEERVVHELELEGDERE